MNLTALARALRALALAWLVVAAGCHKLLGDFEVVERSGGIPSDGAETSCAAGSFRCAGLWLYSCALSQDAWVEAAACATSDLCDSSAGRCRACLAGEYRCNGATLESCNQAESGWVTVETCTSANECNLNSDSCRPCTPGEFQCNGASLQQCDGTGVWIENQNCGVATACLLASDKRSGSCRQPSCTPNEFRCNGGQLLRCDPNGLREVEVTNCRENILCRQKRSNEMGSMGLLPTCSIGCSEGTVRCQEAELQVCRNEEWQVAELCPSADECSASGCRPCIDGEVECNFNRLRRCVGGLWDNLDRCATPALCDATGVQCLDPACPASGAVACLPEGLSRCSFDQRDWQVLDFCASDELCNENDQRCDTPVCEPDARRCVGNAYQYCNASQTGWESGNQCGSGSLCDLAMVCTSSGCNAGEFRCNDTYLEQCDGTAWRRVDRCATAALCQASEGECRPPICGGALPSFECLDRSLRACSPDRDGWVDIRTCSAAEACDAVNGACL